jgi:hypothetical protein
VSSTRFENVVVAIERLRLAVLIQFYKYGLRAAGDAEFSALIGGWDLKDIIKENRHVVEARPPCIWFNPGFIGFSISRPPKKRSSYS